MGARVTGRVAVEMLEPDGPVAEAMADLWWLMLVLGVLVFLLFIGLLAGGLLRNAPDESDDEARHQRLVRRWIGAGGVVMPVVIIVVVFAATLLAMRDVPSTAPAGALEIEVVGHQWWYEVRYPDQGIITANQLHLPVGRPVALQLTSQDVIHSFWVPALGGKLDMLPDGPNTLVLQADEPGEHRSRCAEFCGLQHANMELVVVAQPEDDFATWVADHQEFVEPTRDLAVAGREVFVGSGCVACHTFRGGEARAVLAPDLTDLPSRETLGAGTTPNTREHLIRFIQDPQRVKPGVEMPGTQLTDAELDALLAYLRERG